MGIFLKFEHYKEVSSYMQGHFIFMQIW